MSLTPELTGAGGPTGPQGTNIGHQNREAMANVGVRVERFVRLGREGRMWQVQSKCCRLVISGHFWSVRRAPVWLLIAEGLHRFLGSAQY
jgi:hypothetical protein